MPARRPSLATLASTLLLGCLPDAAPENLPPAACIVGCAPSGSCRLAAHAGDAITLDASCSSDPEDDALTYVWVWGQRPPGSSADFVRPNPAEALFTVDVDGTYRLSFDAFDGNAESNTVQVEIDASPTPPRHTDSPPIITLLEVIRNGPVVLNGSAIDPDGDPVRVHWDLVSRPPSSQSVLVGDPTLSSISFLPDSNGVYEVGFTVTAGGASVAKTVPIFVDNIEVAP